MCKYHKITKLSIAIVSLTSLMLNFLFPHIALASNVIGNNVLSFNFSEPIAALSFTATENNFSFGKIIDKGSESGNIKTLRLPVALTIKEEKDSLVVVSTLAKKINIEEKAIVVSEEENDKIAENICQEAGITDLPCWQDLKAMREKESFGGKEMTGDGGRSRGWYHIQIKMHKITDQCALDFKCSTEWTVKNLVSNGYETNRMYAISRHNGSGPMAQAYARNVVYNSAKVGR